MNVSVKSNLTGKQKKKNKAKVKDVCFEEVVYLLHFIIPLANALIYFKGMH